MSYYVVDLASGQRYGPAELDLLNQWVSEGRIKASTMLEDAVTGSRIPANQVYGLNLPAESSVYPPYQPASHANPSTPYPRGYEAAPGLPPSAGKQDANNAWIWFAVGIACCGLIGYPMSIVCANRAAAAGNDSAKVAKVLSIIFLVLSVVGLIFYLAAIPAALSSSG